VKILASLLILTALAPDRVAAAEPDEPELTTDRPDQTESPTVVPIHTVEVEIGALFTTDEREGTRSEVSGVPGTLVRYGVHRRLELRVEWEGWIEAENSGPEGESRVSEAADPELGVKVSLVAAQGARPEMALLAHLSLHVGGGAFGSPRADPSVRFSAAHTLSERVGLGWNVGWEAHSFRDTSGATHTLTRFIYTASLGVELPKRFGAFIEVFGDLPGSDSERSAHSLDGGVTYLVAPRVQLDLAAGAGLNAQAPDRFVGLGISFRVPR
jgi:hypothetical protein